MAFFALAIVILLLSSWVTIGNGLLNAKNAQRTAAIGQSLVPWPPILILLLFGDKGGALAVSIGMVVGQLCNLVFVLWGVKKLGFNLWPSFRRWPEVPRSVRLVYLSVVANSLLFNAAVPIGVWLGLKFGAGHAGAFVLGSKLVVLTYAVASITTTAVVVPYFARHFVAGEVSRAHRGLVWFLHLSLLVSVAAAVFVYGFAGHIVQLIFGGGRFSAEDVAIVTAVVEFSSLQIPFMLTNLLIVRFSEASSKAVRAFMVTLLSQILTVVITLRFSHHYGAAGIALAGSLGIMIATTVFVLLLVKDRVLTWLDASVSLLGWWLFVTICLCLHFNSVVGALTAGIAFLVLVCRALMDLYVEGKSQQALVCDHVVTSGR